MYATSAARSTGDHAIENRSAIAIHLDARGGIPGPRDPIAHPAIAPTVAIGVVSGSDLKVSRDRGFAVERVRYDYFSCWSSSASGGSCEAAEVAGLGRVVGAVGAVASGSAASFSFAGPVSVSGAGLSGGDPVCVVHRYALAGGAISGAGVAERRDLPPALGGVVAARVAGRRDRGTAAAAGRQQQARLV